MHLIQSEAVFLQPQRQVHHIFIFSTRMCGDEIRDQILLFTGLFRVSIKQFFEALIAAHTRFHHFRKRPFLSMLWCDFQITAHMVAGQLFDITRIFYCQIVANAGGDQDLFDPFQITGSTVQRDRRLMVGIHVRANLRIHTRRPAAGLFSPRGLAAQHIHIRGRPAKIRNNTGKTRDFIANLFDFTNNRVFRATLNNAPFMLRNRAEGATAITAAHDIDRKTNHVIGRDR